MKYDILGFKLDEDEISRLSFLRYTVFIEWENKYNDLIANTESEHFDCLNYMMSKIKKLDRKDQQLLFAWTLLDITVNNCPLNRDVLYCIHKLLLDEVEPSDWWFKGFGGTGHKI